MNKTIIAWVLQNCKFAWTKPRKFDIFTADLSVGSQTKERPALVLSIDKDTALVAPMSSSWEYQKSGDFEINKAHPDFPRTRLNDSGFIKGWSMYIPLRDLHTKIGELSGKLLTQYLRSSRPQPVNENPLSIQRETPISRPQIPDEVKQVNSLNAQEIQ